MRATELCVATASRCPAIPVKSPTQQPLPAWRSSSNVAASDCLSEPEIFARERAEGERVFSAEGRPGRFHRPDLNPPEAIEVELTNKGASRLDALLRAWRYPIVERKVGGVRYLCSPKALP